MPKVIPPAELDALVAAVKANRGGMSVDTLARQLPQLPRRTLQRRLARLVANARLRAEGRGPAAP